MKFKVFKIKKDCMLESIVTVQWYCQTLCLNMILGAQPPITSLEYCDKQI